MIHLKSEKEIEVMKEGGQKLRKAVHRLLPKIVPGVVTEEIDQEAERLIKEQGAMPSFKTVTGYNWTTCLPINEQIVHTPPSKRVIKSGDIVTLDIGAYYKGYHTDWATTVVAGEAKDKKIWHFLETGRRTLKKAIEQAKAGKYIGDISETIEKEIYGSGYFIVRSLTGHGIGEKLHEDPYVPGYLDKPVQKTPLIKPGLTLAIEVIYSMGTEEMAYEEEDKWSIITRDRSMSACFEETIAVTDRKTFILT